MSDQEVLLAAGRHPFTEVTLQRLTSATVKDDGGKSSLPEQASRDSFGLDLGHDLQPGPVNCQELGLDVTCCCICREAPPEGAAGLLQPDRLCRKRSCVGAVCRACLERHVTSAVEASRYAVPFIRCPECRSYVRTASWSACVSASVLEAVSTNASHLLTLRCISCDQPGTLLVTPSESAEDHASSIEDVFGALPEEDCAALRSWWVQYSCGEAEALAGISLAAAGLAEEALEAGDGVPPEQLTRRVQGMLRLIKDDARRAVLQLAFLRRWPKTVSGCCNAEHCFKCKVGGHHAGTSCEDVQRRQMQEDDCIQFCPGCGVATMKSEGCNSMICLCGEHWSWSGEEKWLADWIDQEPPTEGEEG